MRRYKITNVIDVRSYPFSYRNPAFSKESLEKLERKGIINYFYFGNLIGGMVTKKLIKQGIKAFKDALSGENRIFYNIFLQINEIQKGGNTVLLCSEGNPIECHRFLFISHSMWEIFDIDTLHIMRDFSVKKHSKLIEDILLKNKLSIKEVYYILFNLLSSRYKMPQRRNKEKENVNEPVHYRLF